MRIRTVAMLAVLIGMAACGGPAAGNSNGSTFNLALSGTTTVAGSDRTGGPCHWSPAAYNLALDAPLANGDTVSFDVTVPLQAVGEMDAVAPPRTGGGTPLELVHQGHALMAKSGTVKVTEAQIGQRTFKGTLEGAFEDGTTVTGSWSCSAGI